MRTVIEKITPKMAEEWLSNNMVNRNINQYRVASYAYAMANGTWQLNGETIKLDTNGQLIDGQHRLSAIIKAGATVEMMVVYDVPVTVSILDRGRNRNITDSLLIEGMDRTICNNSTVAIAKLYLLISSGGKSTFADEEVKEFLIEHQEGLYQVVEIWGAGHQKNKSGRISIRNAPIGLSLLTAIEQNYPVESLARWCEVVRTGIVNNINEQAAVVFRNDLISNAVDVGSKSNVDRRRAAYQTEKSIQDFVEHKKRKMSYANWNEPVYSNYKGGKQ